MEHQLLNGDDKVILITGASKGIGKYLFDKYSASGFQVLGTFHSALINKEDIRLSKVDISDYISVQQWIGSVKDQLDHIILINCAALSYSSFAHKSDIEKWHNVIKVNIIGAFNVIHVLLPIMRSQGYGRIINFSSVVAQVPTPGVSAYAASKSALWGLSKSLAVENAKKGITVNNINLGYANIGMGLYDVPGEYQTLMKSRIPAGRFCEPEEIYNTIEYIVNTEYLNGSSIDLNGVLL